MALLEREPHLADLSDVPASRRNAVASHSSPLRRVPARLRGGRCSRGAGPAASHAGFHGVTRAEISVREIARTTARQAVTPVSFSGVCSRPDSFEGDGAWAHPMAAGLEPEPDRAPAGTPLSTAAALKILPT